MFVYILYRVLMYNINRNRYNVYTYYIIIMKFEYINILVVKQTILN